MSRCVLIGIVWIFFFPVKYPSCNAQATVSDEVIESLGGGDSVLWSQWYAGYEDHMHSMKIFLAESPTQIRGTGIYQKSNAQFFLEGIRSPGGYRFIELDTMHNVTGAVECLSTNEGGVSCQWTNYNKTMGHVWDLHPAGVDRDVPAHCGIGKWIKSWSGKCGKNQVVLILHQLEEGTLWGTWNDVTAGTSRKCEGELTEGKKMTLRILDGNYTAQGSCQFTLNEKDGLSGIWLNVLTGQVQVSLKKEAECTLSCVDYATLQVAYDGIYPKTAFTDFNEALEKKVQKLFNSFRSFYNKQDYLENTPAAQRSIYSAHIWPEITLMTPDVISMYLHVSRSWSPPQVTSTFNFSMSDGQLLEWDDLLENDHDTRKKIKSLIYTQALALDPQVQNYFLTTYEKEGIDLFALMPGGIEVRAPFHPVYGNCAVTLPYSELQSFIRKNSVIRSLSY
jgi:hypothetical protein